jgi:hypothetical protein
MRFRIRPVRRLLLLILLGLLASVAAVAAIWEFTAFPISGTVRVRFLCDEVLDGSTLKDIGVLPLSPDEARWCEGWTSVSLTRTANYEIASFVSRKAKDGLRIEYHKLGEWVRVWSGPKLLWGGVDDVVVRKYVDIEDGGPIRIDGKDLSVSWRLRE